jgi:hypothetical protein
MKFWEAAIQNDTNAIVCTTNNVVRKNGSLVMGRGIAKEFKERFKYLEWNWGEIVQNIKDDGEEDYHLLVSGPRRLEHAQVYVVGLQTKRFWGEDSPIDLVVKSCNRLKELASLLNWKKVVMPKPGCGNGNLKWREVKKLINMDNRFVITD